MSEISLSQILLARDTRAARQQQLLTQYHCPLICFTMNIAGPVKISPLIKRGFQAGLTALGKALAEQHILFRETEYSDTGCQAFFAVDMDAEQLKILCTEIEESIPLGRLFDMDVLDLCGSKLERQCQRGCIVCGKPGRGCAAGRLHSVAELQKATTDILQTHFRRADREQFADLAVMSLLDEVSVTPKPGLVDRHNCGSHTDMNIDTFITSANALRPYFAQCIAIGQDTASLTPAETFLLLRQAGLDAETGMYKATGGVNTHKGAIFTLGILCGSIGRLWTADAPVAPLSLLFAECGRLGQAAQTDFAAMDGATAGQRLYLQKGLRGIRGEVADGLPAVASTALPTITEGLSKGLSYNDAAACALVRLIARVEDTNLYHRGGDAGAAFAKESANALGDWPTMAQIEDLDNLFISRRLSPGGCADLLAAACFLHRLEAIV